MKSRTFLTMPTVPGTHWLAFGLTMALTACGSTTTAPADAQPESPTPEVPTLPELSAASTPEEPEEPVRYGNFTREQLTDLMLGELGGQRGHMSEAADRFYRLARDTGDTAIIRRAAEYNAAAGNGNRALELTNRWIEREPEALDAYLMRSYHLLQRGEVLAAMDDMATVLSLGGEADFSAIAARSPGYETALRDQVRQRLESLRQRFPDEPSLHYSLAQMLDHGGDRDAAREVLDAARERFGETPRHFIVLAQLLQNRGDSEAAIELLQRGTERYPEHRLIRYNHARLLVQTGELRRAREQFGRLLQQSPGDLDSLYSLAMINVELGNDRDAMAQLEALANAGHRRDEALYYLGTLAERNRMPEQALQWYEGVQRGSGGFLAAQRQALRLLARQGLEEQASDWTQRVSQRHPDLEAVMATLEAEALLAAGLHDRAGTLLDDALSRHPGNVDLLFARVTLSEQLDRPACARRDLRRILEEQPENVRALNHLGYSLTVYTDRYEEALSLIEHAIALEPDDPAIIDSLGWVQFKLGQLDDALYNLQRAYEQFPNHEVAAHLGEVLWVRGERERAMSIWRDALEDEPDSEYINDAMDRLAR